MMYFVLIDTNDYRYRLTSQTIIGRDVHERVDAHKRGKGPRERKEGYTMKGRLVCCERGPRGLGVGYTSS